MAVQHGRELCRGRVEMQRSAIVEKIEVVPFEEEYVGLGQAAAGARAIDVAANSVDGSDACECLEDFTAAYVAHVKNVVTAFQRRQSFRPKQAVRIAEKAELHRLKLKISDQRIRDFFLGVSHGRAKGLLTIRSVPGWFGSSSTMQ